MLLVYRSWYEPVRTTSTRLYMRPGSHLAHITGQSDPSS